MEQVMVESGVPMPESRRGKGPKVMYPHAQMKVGDSFFVGGERRGLINEMCTRNKKMGERLKMKFIAKRVVEGEKTGVRVWRIK